MSSRYERASLIGAACLPPIVLWTVYLAVSMTVLGLAVGYAGTEWTTVVVDGLVVNPVDRFLAH